MVVISAAVTCSTTRSVARSTVRSAVRSEDFGSTTLALGFGVCVLAPSLAAIFAAPPVFALAPGFATALKLDFAPVPGFDSGTIQKKLRKLLEQSQDELRLERARLHQLEGSYIWPPLAQNRG